MTHEGEWMKGKKPLKSTAMPVENLNFSSVFDASHQSSRKSEDKIMALVKQTQKLVMSIITAATVFGWQAVPAAAQTQEYQQVPLRINTTLVVDDKLMIGDNYSIPKRTVQDGVIFVPERNSGK